MSQSQTPIQSHTSLTRCPPQGRQPIKRHNTRLPSIPSWQAHTCSTPFHHFQGHKVKGQGHQAALVGCTGRPTWTYSNGDLSICAHDAYLVTTCRPGRGHIVAAALTLLLASDSITIPSSCIARLLTPRRHSSITSRLRTPSLYPRPATRTKHYTSFIHHALLNYQ